MLGNRYCYGYDAAVQWGHVGVVQRDTVLHLEPHRASSESWLMNPFRSSRARQFRSKVIQGWVDRPCFPLVSIELLTRSALVSYRVGAAHFLRQFVSKIQT